MRLIDCRRAENDGRLARMLAGVPIVIGVFAVGLVLFGTRDLMTREHEAAAEVALSLSVMQSVERIKADFQTGMSEARGFYLSKDPSDLARSNAAIDSIGSDVAKVRSLAARSKEETSLVDRLEPVLTARLASLRRTMTLPLLSAPTDASTRDRRREAQAMTLEILDDLDAIRTEERNLLDQRQSGIARIVSRLTWGIVAGGMIAATSGFAIVAMLIGRGRERRHLAELSRLNTALEERVRERTAALARSQARQRGYFDNSPIGIFVALLREDGEVVHEDVNSAFAAIYGFSRDDMVGRTLRELWPGPFARDVEQRIQACLLSGQLAQYTVTRELRGETRTLDVMLVPLPDATAGAPCAIGCLRDVTEKVELERQVVAHLTREAEAAELERVLLRNSPDVLSLIRVDGDPESPIFVYEACSPAIECLTGLPPDAMIGRRPEEVLTPIVAEEVNRRLRLCAIENENGDLRLVNSAADRPAPTGGIGHAGPASGDRARASDRGAGA